MHFGPCHPVTGLPMSVEFLTVSTDPLPFAQALSSLGLVVDYAQCLPRFLWKLWARKSWGSCIAPWENPRRGLGLSSLPESPELPEEGDWWGLVPGVGGRLQNRCVLAVQGH